jgi:hypothetical protein
MPVMSLAVMVVIPDDNRTLRRRADKIESILHAGRKNCTFLDLPDTHLGKAAVRVHLLLPED